MNQNILLQNLNGYGKIDEQPQAITPEIADRLARHHLALAQLYRSIAGTEPLPTNAHQKRMRQANR